MSLLSPHLLGRLAHNMRTPVYKLSEDVLLIIFELVVMHKSKMALRISHVSSLWRSIALSSSTLWTNISTVNRYTPRLNRRSGRHDHTRLDFHILQHYLDLSKNRLIDVSVDARMPNFTARTDERMYVHNDVYHMRTRNIAVQLASQAHRIRSLSFECDSYFSLFHFFHTVESEIGDEALYPLVQLDVKWKGKTEALNFDLLHSSLRFGRPLEFMLQDDVYDQPLERLLPQPTLGLKLQTLTLHGIKINWDNFTPSGLRDLNLYDMSLAIAPTYTQLRCVLLKNAATLKKLRLVNVFSIFNTHDEADVKQLVLPHVLSLRLGYVNPKDLDAIISTLVLPSMWHLTIANVGRKHYESISGLMTYDIHDDFVKTQALFGKLATDWDLRTLQSVKLVDVHCIFQNAQLPEWNHPHMMFDQGYHHSISTRQTGREVHFVWGPIKFWQACTGLKQVSLTNPDAAILYSLYCPVPEQAPYASKSRSDGVTTVERKTRIGTFSDGEWITSFDCPSRIPVPDLRTIKISGVDRSIAEAFMDRREYLIGQTMNGVHARYDI